MFKNNIIDLSDRFKAKNLKGAPLTHGGTVSQEARKGKGIPEAPILDMTQRREAILNEERREVRRTILTGFVGAFAVIPLREDGTGGLLKVDIYDISENGIAFDVDERHGHFRKSEEIAMRVYLSHDTYFPFIVTVQNFRTIKGEGSYRHGANFLKGTVNDEALHHFVKFIETVSASLQRDTGDVMVSGLKK